MSNDATVTTSNYHQVINYIPKKSDSYYIASGFFNPNQVKTVDAIEASLKGLNQKFFSPRSESIAFFKESDPQIKSMMTKLIFNNNLDCMKSSNKFIVNLQDEDQGTLFEYGYIVGCMQRTNNLAYEMSKNIKVMNDLTNLEYLIFSNVTETEEINKGFISEGKDYDFVSNLLSNYERVRKLFMNKGLAILSIDDRNPINMFLVGLFYSEGIPVVTYSRKGYGSNVMLVHSTYHCETEDELKSLIEELEKDIIIGEGSDSLPDFLRVNTSKSVINRLFTNKQTWNKVID
jgi:nucleoside 2-deoxyribosyltransferase